MSFAKILALSTIAFSSAVIATPESILEAWQGFSDPDVLASGFVHRLNQLPAEGAMVYNPKAWSGDYWPSSLGGINYRWNSNYPVSFNYQSPSLRALRGYDRTRIAALSPTEKFDIYVGRYDYPLKAEVAKTVSPQAKDWEGICHGWAPASVNHAEPDAVDATNDEGIVVPFGSSDVKALLSYYYATHTNTDGTTYAGLRCDFGRWTGGRKECDQDFNAGAFHIIITNLLGIKHQGFIADIDRWDEVWNQPIVAFRSQAISGYTRPSRGAAANAVWEVKIQTSIFYTDEGDNSFYPLFGTDGQKFATKTYTYTLELNASGDIVGGEWLSADRPDFAWKKPKVKQFTGLLERLPELLIND